MLMMAEALRAREREPIEGLRGISGQFQVLGKA